MGVYDFLEADAHRTLFPLDGPSVVIGRAEAELRKFIDEQIFASTDYHPNFVQAPIAFAMKNELHTRRVHLLDPIATLFLYDFVYSNSAAFKAAAKTADRRRYGYHFKGKAPLSASDEHQEFRQRIVDLKKQYKFFCKCDIANCFSSFYHHDLVSMLKPYAGEDASNRFGTFLRQINAGRSISCFPQGYFPSKAIGNLFLAFIENSAQLKSPAIIRYVDDVFIFSNSLSQLESDFYTLQSMLSERNLYLNASKTKLGDTKTSMPLPKTETIRKRLLQKRSAAVEAAYDEEPEEVHLTEDEFQYLSGLISRDNVTEEDVELALALVTEDEEHAERLAALVFQRYPHLIKSLYANLGTSAYDGAALWHFLDEIASNRNAHEFVLFWCVRIALDYFDWDKTSAETLMRLYDHPRSSDAVKAAILESEFLDFGMFDRKDAALRNAGSSLLAMSAAVGLRKLEKAKRNQMYKYAASSAPLMYQITRALQKGG